MATNQVPSPEPPEQPEPATQPKGKPTRRARRGLWRSMLAWLPVGTLLLAGILGGAVWWTTREGSLATALDLAAQYTPLEAEGVSGAILGGGRIAHLAWNDNGLDLQIDDAVLNWNPRALLQRRLEISQLSAQRVVVAMDPDRPKSNQPSAPPDALALPFLLQIRADHLQVDEFRWEGPPPQILSNVRGSYRYDNQQHLLELDSVHYEEGEYQARVHLDAAASNRIDAVVTGQVVPPIPEAQEPLRLAVRAGAQGPLTQIQAWADAHALPDSAEDIDADPGLPELPENGAEPTPSPPADEQPWMHASATVAPWDAQPLPQARARFNHFDAGALWSQAPRTGLSGQVQLHVLDAEHPEDWAIRAQLQNDNPGPWDTGHLPLQDLDADLQWHAEGLAVIEALQAHLGDGTLSAAGTWRSAPTAADDTDSQADKAWAVQAELAGINPAQLYSTLAALPLNGTASAQGDAGNPANLNFEAALEAGKPAAHASLSEDAQRMTKQLQDLQLQAVQARGRWADGQLDLPELLLRTSDARIDGSAQLALADPANIDARADLTVEAPGLQGRVQGSMGPRAGKGSLSLDLSDAARTLAWAQRLPGADQALAGMQASGSARLNGSWDGGWQDPAVDATLSAPGLRLVLAESDPAQTIELQALQGQLSGRLSSAKLELDGQGRQGERAGKLKLRASGGITNPPGNPMQAQAQVDQLDAEFSDPALGKSPWRVASAQPLTLKWSAAGGGRLDTSAGELALSSTAPSHTAQLRWEPTTWSGGQLKTSGSLSGLPLQWLERTGAVQFADSGLEGNLVLGGHWDATLGSTLKVDAVLQRESGDLTIVAADPQTGVKSRVSTGIRDAQLRLQGEGETITARLDWDTEHAGTIRAAVDTRLTRSRDSNGKESWSWSPKSRLQGTLKAELPQLSAWSILAPPGWRLHGSIHVDGTVDGTAEAPQMGGTIRADDLALRSVVDGIQFEDGRLRAHVEGMRLVLDEFVLHGSGQASGTLRATGEAGLLDGKPRARLQVALEELQASVRDDRKMTVSGQVEASFADQTIHADGQLKVDHALIILPDESRPSLGDDVVVYGRDGKPKYGSAPAPQAVQTSTVDAEDLDALALPEDSGLKSDVGIKIDLGEDFQVRGMGVETRLTGNLELAARGPITQMPTLRGRVQTQDGHVHAYGQQLIIDRGNIFFSGDISNPGLDILALRPIYTSDQRVGAQVRGTALLPDIRLYSDPVLPDDQAVAWLMLGHGAPEDGAEAALLQSAMFAILSGREGRGLASSFGLDELSFAQGEEGSGESASLTLGKRLSDRLYTAYEASLGGTGGVLLVFYELSRRWVVRARAGDDSAVDLLYRLSYN